mmetsp:Transcript_2713/g.3585  ORF Transcript_2713/g.3585 Transcript_2713/m.3585 type:complete len:94 (+) Transcript_2713:313-594(+)
MRICSLCLRQLSAHSSSDWREHRLLGTSVGSLGFPGHEACGFNCQRASLTRSEAMGKAWSRLPGTPEDLTNSLSKSLAKPSILKAPMVASADY